MTIVVESVATAAPGGGATTTVCDKPTGTAEGDLLVALVGGAFASGTPDVTLSGWTRRAWRVTTTMFFAVLTKVAGGSEPTSYTFNNGLSASTRRAAIMRVSGADPTTPFDGTPSTNDGSGTTITGTGITTGEDNSLVCLAGNWSANSTTFTPAEGSGLVSMNRIGVAGAVQSSAGATGNKTATISNGPWIGVVFAIMGATPSNTSPTVTPNTADAAELDTTPTVEFTGTDPDNDPITYQVQISNVADYQNPVGDLNLPGSPTGIIHPNPSATTGWDGNYLIDDRPGQCFEGSGGILDSIIIRFNKDADTNGTAYIKIYPFDTATTYGSTGAPEGARPYTTAPIPDPIAISDGYFIDTSDSLGHVDRTLTFSGSNRIQLEDGVKYVFIVDWWPVNSNYNNTITIQIDSISPTHPGNLYQDGNGSASINNGPQAGWDMYFQVNEVAQIYTANSNADGGFENTITPADTDPFNSGEQIAYTSPEIAEGTWYWRVRGKDPDGTNAFGDWSSTRSFTATAGSAGINADLSVTCENATLSSTGEIAVGGSLDKALEDADLSADGAVLVSGGLDATLADATLTAEAALPVIGTLDAVLGDATLEANGTVGSTPITADLDVVCSDASLSADGSVAVSGGLDAALANATLTADATLPVTSSLDAIFGDTSLEAGGTIGAAAIIADLVVTCEDAILNASSAVLVGGEFDMVGADATLTASGTVSVSGALDAQLDGATLESSATVGYAPNGADLSVICENASLSADGAVLVSASLAVMLADGGLNAEGSVLVVGSSDILLDNATLTAFGRVGQVSGIQLELDARGLAMQLDDRQRGFVLKNRDRRFHGQ